MNSTGDWGAYFRWPSRGESWSALAWLLLVPKLALAALVWVVVIVVILAVVFAPAAAITLLGDAMDLPALLTILGSGAAFVATLYFAAELLDL